MKNSLAVLAVAAALNSGCVGQFPFIVAHDASRDMVQARIQQKLGNSQVTHQLLERRTIQWVDENLSTRFRPPASFADTGEYAPDRVVWVSYLEGTLEPSLWPTARAPGRGFSSVLTIYSLDGTLMAATANPLPREEPK